MALGKIAFDIYLDLLRRAAPSAAARPSVSATTASIETAPGQPVLISSYHPSQQNTSTGKLTEKMLRDVFRRARRVVERPR